MVDGIFAHGVGSRGDLPLPLWMFSWGAAATLVISFVALGVLWREPRLSRAADGRLLGSRRMDSAVRGVLSVGRLVALVLFLVSLWAGLFGLDDTSRNILPVALYVIVWVGILLVSAFVGDVWREVHPLVTIVRGMERWRSGSTPASRPPTVFAEQWPAAAALFVFLFFELAHPTGSSPYTLGGLLLTHTLVALSLGWRWGSEWLADHEPFAVLFSLVAAMAPFVRADRQIRLRAPISGLSRVRSSNGVLALLLVVLGGTTYDGFSESELGRDLLGRPSGWGGAVTQTIGLAASMVVIGGLYWLGVWWTGRVTNTGQREIAVAFAPSLVPIVVGYALAHYAQLLVDETQSFVFLLSDPGGLGWDLFGGADARIDFTLVSADAIAWIQVLAILVGHVGAVFVAHDFALERFRPGDSFRSQFVMLLVMVGYSTLGLWLLLNA